MEADTGESNGTGQRNPGGAPKGNSNARKHGFNVLRAGLTQLGSRVIDGRSSLGYALKKWRRELIADLGGDDSISTQQLAVVDLAVKSKVLLDSIDAWLLSQHSLINHRKRSVIPVVLQRQSLADGLAKYLSMLGLERRHKVQSISEILAADHHDDTPVSNGKAE
jgi:hypothetical protein